MTSEGEWGGLPGGSGAATAEVGGREAPEVRSNTAHLSHGETGLSRSCMIDWLSFSMPYSGKEQALQEFKHNTLTGELRGGPSYGVPVLGSWQNTILGRSNGVTLWLSGNPSKFVKGENFTGTLDMPRLILAMYEAWLAMGQVDCPLAREAMASGRVELSRVDICQHVLAPDGETASSWAQHIGNRSEASHRPRKSVYGTSCAWGVGKGKGTGSRRSHAKLYDKQFEMIHGAKGGRPTCGEMLWREIAVASEGIVRFETTTRGMELKRLHAQWARDWSDPATLERVHGKWLDAISVEGEEVVMEHDLTGLHGSARMLYVWWREGKDCRSLIGNGISRATFFRAKKDLRGVGVNIDLPPPPVEASAPVRKVVTLREVFSGRTVERDVELFEKSWALGRGAAPVIPLKLRA